MKKRNILQTKAILIISFLFIALIVAVTSIEYVNSKKLILSNMENSGKQTVTIHAQNLSSWVKARLSQVEVIANTQLVSSMKTDEIIPYFKREQQNYDGVFNSFGISDSAGKLHLQNDIVVDISTEDTFGLVMKGQEIISNPFQDKQNPDNWIISMECPVRDLTGNKVVGLVSGACLVSTVYKKNTDFHLGKTDKVYILNKDGTVLYHPNGKLINKSNFLKNSNSDFTAGIQEALSKNSYIGKYKDKKETKMLFSSKVEGTDWYMFLEVPLKEYTASINQLMNLVVMVTIISILILIIILFFILRSFFRRLTKLSHISGEVAEGNLVGSLPESSDELGMINMAFNKMINNLKSIIIKIKKVTEVIVTSSDTYKNVSLEVIESGKNIRQSIEDITAGAKSTTDEIQNITVSINDMENRSKELVEISENIDTMISQTKNKTSEGSKSLADTVKELYMMKESVDVSSEVITDLSEKSDIIANISTTISSISHQTNLLALNASIEAARAGESGKGFSVVADEIRTLADQSSHAAQGIAEEVQQIQQQIVNAVTSMKGSINYVNSGTGSIDRIQTIFGGIEDEIENVKALSSTVFEIAKELLDENKKINEAVCNTSAISEEAVASTICFQDMINSQEKLFSNLQTASEQLDELTVSLSGEISHFKI